MRSADGRSLRQMIHTRGRRSLRRGFTVPELLVASVLTGLLLLGALRLVIGLIDMSATHADLNQPRLTARYLADQFTEDISAAVVCDPTGLGTPVAAFDDDELAVYADVRSDGHIELVRWRYVRADGTLQRAVVRSQASLDGADPTELPDATARQARCSFADDNLDWVALASFTVPDAHAQTFVSYGGDDTFRGTCTTMDTRCRFGALSLHVTPRSPATGARASSTTTVNLEMSGSLLR